MAGRPKGTAKAAPKPAKEQKVKAQPANAEAAPKVETKATVTSANDYINQLTGNVPPARVEGHTENAPQIGSYIEEGGEVTQEQLDALQSITAPANIYVGNLQSSVKIDDELKIKVINVEQEAKILEKYEQVCNTPSDINQLLPYLRAVADECDHITELGVRTPTSTWALLAGNPKKLVSYDIVKDPKVSEVEALAPNFEFVLGSSLEVELEETDFLFIDTYHTALQLEKELALHASKARRYIGFHDIFSYGDVAEKIYPGIDPALNDGRGINYAIYPFLQDHPEWVKSFQTHANNGLLILKRIS
jgi:hypothetical protein